MQNPFASPHSDTSEQLAPQAAPAPSQLTRRTLLLMVPDGAELPPRCVVCNTGANLMAKRFRFYYHRPLAGLLACGVAFIAFVLAAGYLGVLLGFAAGLATLLLLLNILQRRAVVTASVCRQHRPKIIAPLLVLLAGGALSTLIVLGRTPAGEWLDGTPMIIGALVAIATVIVAMLSYNVLWTSTINSDGDVWIAGCGEAFLDSFPSKSPPPPDSSAR